LDSWGEGFIEDRVEFRDCLYSCSPSFGGSEPTGPSQILFLHRKPAAINEAEAFVERTEARWWSADLHRLRGVFLAAMGAHETEIEASFCEALKIACEQKSVSLEKRAEATRNIVAKKRVGQENVGSDWLFSNLTI
jgi:hypothetical protein